MHLTVIDVQRVALRKEAQELEAAKCVGCCEIRTLCVLRSLCELRPLCVHRPLCVSCCAIPYVCPATMCPVCSRLCVS